MQVCLGSAPPWDASHVNNTPSVLERRGKFFVSTAENSLHACFFVPVRAGAP